jgi:hypothetical protein
MIRCRVSVEVAKDNRQQRLFAVHFQDVSPVGHFVGDSVGLNVDDCEGFSEGMGASVSLSVDDSVGLHVDDSDGFSEEATVTVSDGASIAQDHSDGDDDEEDSGYSSPSEDSEDEENKRCDHEIEDWVKERINMNDPKNERKV